MYHLTVSGSPRKRGEIHGESFRKPIHELAQIRTELLLRSMPDWTRQDLNWMAMKELRTLERHPALYEEFHGISDGAGIALFDLVFLNNYTDMRDLAADPSQIPPSRRDEGCSIFASLAEGRAICGQTWDMHGSASPYMLHLSVKGAASSGDTASAGPELNQEILTVVGCLGLTGVNQNSLCVLINNLRTHETSHGLIWPALVRALLSQPDTAAAARFLADHLPASGHNYLLMDPREIVDIETTGKRFQVVFQTRAPGVYFHTNHYLGDLKAVEAKELISTTSHRRYEALEKYFAGFTSAKATRHGLQRGIFEASEVCKAVCIPRSETDPHASATCGGITYDLSSKEGESFKGLFTEKDHFQFRW